MPSNSIVSVYPKCPQASDHHLREGSELFLSNYSVSSHKNILLLIDPGMIYCVCVLNVNTQSSRTAVATLQC